MEIHLNFITIVFGGIALGLFAAWLIRKATTSKAAAVALLSVPESCRPAAVNASIDDVRSVTARMKVVADLSGSDCK